MTRAAISLSALGHGGAVLVLGAAMIGGAWLAGFDPRQLRLGQTSAPQQANPIARRLIVYRLDRVRPTVFRFTQPVTLVRLVTQPVLPRGAAQPGKAWVYTVRAELLDTGGRVMATRAISSRALLLDAQGRRIGRRQFFRGSSDELALGDEVRIAFEQPFAALRLTTIAADPGLKHIDVRVSERRPLIASAAASAFARLSPEDQQRLAEPNAFPPALLTQAERTAIAVNQWRPVGPLGIEGRDHQMAVLYEEEAPASAAWEQEMEGDSGE